MGHAIAQTVMLETETCGECGIGFALPAWLMKRARETGEVFYCPHGHGINYRYSEVQRLRDKLNEQTRVATQMAERAKQAEASEQGTLKQMQRLKKRVAAGVCPCCNRTFQQLARHMKTKHPDHGG